VKFVALDGYIYCDSNTHVLHYLNDDLHMFINSVVVQEWRGGAACCEEEPHIFVCEANCFSPHMYLIIIV
jgi:hypothetical protein